MPTINSFFLLRNGVDNLLLRDGTSNLLLRSIDIIADGPIYSRLLHIHAAPGQPCIADGALDDGATNLFVLNPGYWNTLNRRCSPQVIISPQFAVTNRQDIRTSALLGERRPSRRKVNDRR
jgi:hypothetical protein